MAKTVGIDEHSFIRNKYGHRDFATIFVNYNNKRVQEVVYGRSPAELYADTNLKKIPGRENVQNVITDLSSGFRSFAREYFPNAIVTADKFHVLKLLSGPLQKYKREVIGKSRRNPFKKMLLIRADRLRRHEKILYELFYIFIQNLKTFIQLRKHFILCIELRVIREHVMLLTDLQTGSRIQMYQNYKHSDARFENGG